MVDIREGDCVELMAAMPEASVDSVVCDPPYLLGFMGKAFDSQHRQSDGVSEGHAMQDWHEVWAREALRVLKPGGHCLVFGGTRTYHRLMCALEDAGFEIRDCLSYLYGSGFPKSHNIGNGYGTALKPAWEPIVVARKPLAGTVAANVLEYGTGAINVDGCRIGTEVETWPVSRSFTSGISPGYTDGIERGATQATGSMPAGRWPANVILTHTEECVQVGTRKVRTGKTVVHNTDGTVRNRIYGKRAGSREDAGYADADGKEEITAWKCVEGCPVRMLDEQSGETRDGVAVNHNREIKAHSGNRIYGACANGTDQDVTYGGSGGASRFFYTAKASSAERNAGLDGLPVSGRTDNGYGSIQTPKLDRATPRENWAPHETRNNHPTVKPIDLMRWLVRLVTPPDGTVLDPFLGSGTTGCAAVLEGFQFIGIEREPEYVTIAKARIAFWRDHPTHLPVEDALAAEASRRRVRDSGQLSF